MKMNQVISKQAEDERNKGKTGENKTIKASTEQRAPPVA